MVRSKHQSIWRSLAEFVDRRGPNGTLSMESIAQGYMKAYNMNMGSTTPIPIPSLSAIEESLAQAMCRYPLHQSRNLRQCEESLADKFASKMLKKCFCEIGNGIADIIIGMCLKNLVIVENMKGAY